MTGIHRTIYGALLLAAGLAMAGCSSDGGLTTGSIGGEQTAAAEPKVDPVCVTLTSQIDGLRKEGVADKIAKAAAKKYKMTHADLTKADQLTKASADFQARCSTLSPKPPMAAGVAKPASAQTAEAAVAAPQQ
jgi:hypothetical protein